MTPNPRERLITGAIALIRERGVAGTALADVLTRSGVARRSIYQNFPRGKVELVEESTRVAGETMAGAIAHFTAGENPAEALIAFVSMWKETLIASDYTAGCPIVAAALAGSDAPRAPSIAGEVFERWVSSIAAQLIRSGVERATATSLASAAVCAVEGATVVCTATRSTRPLDDVGLHLNALVRASVDFGRR